nr:MAG TPA: DNA-directed RNA polymerase [Caudoviricetes sp.]
MNKVFLVIGATLCYVGGFGITIFLLGVITELCIEIWNGKFKEICNRNKVMPRDVLYLAQNRKEVEAAVAKQIIRWPNMDNVPHGCWECPECGKTNPYMNDDKNIAYCCSCGQAVNMDYYRRHTNDSHMDT